RTIPCCRLWARADPATRDYQHERAIFWTNSTRKVGASAAALPPDAFDIDGRTSPEISTLVFTNGESALSIAASRYIRLVAADAALRAPATGSARSSIYAS